MAITRIEGQDGSKLKIYPNGSIDVNVKDMDMTGAAITVEELKVKDVFRGNVTETKAYLSEMSFIGLVNDGTDELTIEVNGMSIPVLPKEPFEEFFDPFTTVTITTTGPYRAFVKG